MRIFCGINTFYLIICKWYLCSSGNDSSIEENESDRENSDSESSRQLETVQEQMWPNDLGQNTRAPSVVITALDPITLNISDTGLATIRSVIQHSKFNKTSNLLINNLGVDGNIVYTVNKVMCKLWYD